MTEKTGIPSPQRNKALFQLYICYCTASIYRLQLLITAISFRPAPLVSQFFFCRGLGSRQARGEHAEGRAGNIVQSDGIEELNGRGLTAMLSADSDFECWLRLASQFRGHANQPAHSLAVQGAEWVLLDDAPLHIRRQKAVDIIA